jgi:hypothetical protein
LLRHYYSLKSLIINEKLIQNIVAAKLIKKLPEGINGKKTIRTYNVADNDW